VGVTWSTTGSTVGASGPVGLAQLIKPKAETTASTIKIFFI